MATTTAAAAGLPWRLVLALTLCQFISAFSFAVLFPFVPFMVVDLVRGPDVKEAGMYTGLLISASQLGKILTSFCWGLWSDRRGRKPVLAAGLLGISVGSLLFGVSGSFSMALAGRMICGCTCL